MKILNHVLVILNALRLAEHCLHLNFCGDYSRHLLFERLYGGLVEEFDKVAEHFVRLGGEVDAAYITEQGLALQKRWYKTEDPLECALNAEQDLMKVLATACKQLGSDLGADNTLRGIADSHSTAIYLLQQTMKCEEDE
jgi:DNA-binding ferritin-like protein